MAASPSEIATRAKFDYIRYAQAWEDPDLHRRALQIGPGDHVLAIAAAGDNSFAHLLDDPQRVIAVDLNPTQIALCELKKTALARLDYPDLLAFLGVRPHKNRWQLYQLIRDDLPAIARAFFDDQRDVIDDGLIHGGKLERYFHHFRSKVLPLIHSRELVERLCSCFSLAEQRQLYHDQWNNRRWRWILGVFFGRLIVGRLGRDPEFFKYVTVPNVGQYFLSRAEFALTQFLVAENYYLAYVLQGNYPSHRALPPYLLEANQAILRERLPRLEFRLESVEATLDSVAPGTITRANLSNIFEYMSQESTTALLSRLVAVASPALRIGYWNLLVRRNAPESMADRLRIDGALSERLSQHDRAFLYSRYIVEHGPDGPTIDAT